MNETKRVPIPEEDRAKLFLWCARHCCFCGKSCTTNIVIHHIDGDPSNNDFDNLIPVCFDCHGELEKYNPQHPVGTKYRYLEIKTRRDQIFNKYTLPYLRQAEIKISKYMAPGILREIGDTSCTVRTLSQDLPIQIKLKIEPYHSGHKIECDIAELYSGKAIWNINPGQIVYGHFKLPISFEESIFDYRVEISWVIIDILGKEHNMLPFSYVWDNKEGDWWYDPRIIYSS